MDLKNTDEYKKLGYSIITCPICGEETLDCYWICQNCGWEYDGVTAENDYSSANKSTVKNYRTEYLGNE